MNPQRPDVGYPEHMGRLSPDWIVGFVDGEGCFHIGINKNDGLKFGYQVLPELTVVQHEKDMALLHRIRTFMGCGVVRRNHADRWCWRVRKIENLITVVVPFFEKHPLLSRKNVEFRKFARVVHLMEKGEHLQPSGFQTIVKIASEMNLGRERNVRIKIESTLR